MPVVPPAPVVPPLLMVVGFLVGSPIVVIGAEGGAGSSVVSGGAVSGGTGGGVVEGGGAVSGAIEGATYPSKAVTMRKEPKIKGAFIFDTISIL